MGKKAAKRQAKEQAKLAGLLTQQLQTQFGRQQQILDFLLPQVKSLLEEPGFSAATRAALKTGVLESAAARFGSAERAVQERSFIMGGRQIPSGAQDQLRAILAGGRAQTEAEGLRNVQLAEEEARQRNRQFGLGLLAGPIMSGAIAAPGLAGPALGARESAFQMAQATPGWGSILARIGAAAGGLLLAPMTGGASAGALGSLFGGTRIGNIFGGSSEPVLD